MHADSTIPRRNLMATKTMKLLYEPVTMDVKLQITQAIAIIFFLFTLWDIKPIRIPVVV